MKCSKGSECTNKNCYYSHNENELNYHPLVYKKIHCQYFGNNFCTNSHCSKTHSANEVKYEINDLSDTMITLLSLFNNQHQSGSISYKSSISSDLPSEFNPLTYKTIECPLASSNLCKLESRLCLNYHNETERRRVNVSYEPKSCPNVYQAESNQWLSPTVCQNGERCSKCHNKYEYMYHKDIFRTKACPYELKMKTYCNYLLTCPFKHKDDTCEDGIICNKEVIGKYYLEKINDHKIKQIERKKILQLLLQRYQCHECRKDLTNERQVAKTNDNNEKQMIICEDCAIRNHNSEDSDINHNNNFSLIELN